MAKKKKEKKSVDISVPPWMTTFSDMTVLLLTFFIILLTVAEIDGTEMKIILSNFPGLDRLLTGTTLVEGPLATTSQLHMSAVSDEIDNLLASIENRLSGIFQFELEQNIVQLTSDERGLVVSLASDYFFQRYSAEVDLVQGGDILRKIADILRDYTENNEGHFRIEGHSDEKDIPIGTGYQDEWELSSARAISTLRVLEKFLVPLDNAQVAGFGGTRPFIKDEDSDSPFNRRVDIIVLHDGIL